MSTFPKVHSAPDTSSGSGLSLALDIAVITQTSEGTGGFFHILFGVSFSVINNQVAYLKHLAQFLFELYWADVCMYQ